MVRNIISVLLAILIAGSAVVAWGLYRVKEHEHAKLIEREDKLKIENITKKKLDKQLASIKNGRNFVKKRLAEATEEAKALEAELAKEKREAESINQKIIDLNRNATTVEEEIAKVKSGLEQLGLDVASVVDDTLRLKEELVLLEKTRDALKERAEKYASKKRQAKGPLARRVRRREIEEAREDLEEDLEEEEQIVEADLTEEVEEIYFETGKPDIVGEVLTINREFDFVVVSIGKNDGIKEGMVLVVSRDDTVLAKAEVETVRQNISAATLIDKDSISRLRAGDKVYFLY